MISPSRGWLSSLLHLFLIQLFICSSALAQVQGKRLLSHQQEALRNWQRTQVPEQVAPATEKEKLLSRYRAANEFVNIRVALKKVVEIDDHSQAFSLLLRHTGRHHDTQIGQAWQQSGFTIGYMKDGFMAQFSALMQSRRVAANGSLQLVMASGTPGFLQIGYERVDIPFHFFGRYYDSAMLREQFIGAQLEVKATLMQSGLIEVTLRPRFTGFKDETTTSITTLASTVYLPDGGALVIGAAPESGNSIANSLFSVTKERTKRNMMMLLKVDVVRLGVK